MVRTRVSFFTSVAIVAALGLATPLLAAQRDRGERSGGGNGTAERRGAPRNDAPAPRNDAPRNNPQPQPRNDAPSARPAPQERGPAPAPQNQGGFRPFQNQRPVPAPAVPPQPRVEPRAVPRPGPVPREYDGRPNGPAPRYDSRPNDYRGPAPRSGYNDRYPNRYVAPRAVPYSPYRYGRAYVVRPPVFTQRYYNFRPQFRLGFGGLSVGFGFAYPFQYWDPYAFYNFRVGVVPGYNVGSYYSRVGGISFDLDPYDAAVFIDGEFVGYAADFGPTQMPLTLSAGRHHIDLQADGYLDASFDISIIGGQVIPYQGSLAIR